MNSHYSSIVESAGCLLDDIAFWKKQHDDQSEVLISTRAIVLEQEKEINRLRTQIHGYIFESENRELPIPYGRQK